MAKTKEIQAPEKLSIAEQADWWVIQLDSSYDDPKAPAALENWLSQGEEHQNAYQASRFLWAELDLVAESLHSSASANDDLTDLSEELIPRRFPQLGLKGFFSGFMLAAMLLISAMNATEIIQNLQADYRTAEGERLKIELPDGSLASLGADTALAVEWSQNSRRIELLRGEVLFQVTPDPDRPFVVETSSGTATALGTRYYVSLLNEKTDIYVDEGLVEVSTADQSRKMKLGLRQAAWITPTGDLRPRKSVKRDHFLAWQDHRLVLHNQPISDVIDALDREYNGTILLIDLGREKTRLSGSFQTEDIPAALRAIALTLDAEFQELPGDFLLLKI